MTTTYLAVTDGDEDATTAGLEAIYTATADVRRASCITPAVALLRGDFGSFYTVRIASVLGDPEYPSLYRVGDTAPGEAADADDIFADAIDELINDLAQWAQGLATAGAGDEAELLMELAVPWLRKEAAQCRAATARQYFLAAAQLTGGLVGPGRPITMSAPARNLYTDRGNLSRTITQALDEEAARR